ncbi:MAG: two-component sensor histidine kinase [Clostridiales bacterium GWB2_37_7]|nr:MAG: two-component sensor histidine kinase [Clostridiales bacterium GWB2_37_7]
MKISLMKKLSLGFMLAVLGSIILASLISNYIIGKEFNKYLIDEHKSKIDNAIKIAEDLYSEQNTFSGIDQDEIQRYAAFQELYIEIKDLNNKVVYNSGNLHMQLKGMMENMMGSKMQNSAGMDVGKYTENNYKLTAEDNVIGTITVGYFDTSYLSSSSITFINTLNYSFIISALIAIFFGLIISIIISRQLSSPLAKITETSNKMRAGNLEVKAVVKTSTKEIDELSNSINYLAKTLKAQEMLRKRLTTDMAHELRTPLTTLKTHIEAFIDGIWEPTTERFEIFNEEIDRLIKLVGDLRNLAKLEQINTDLQISNVNLSTELEKIIETFEPLFTKENTELIGQITSGINAEIDKDKFKQIMNNLLSNAYNHLRINGKVEVVLTKQNQNIIIKVIDNGIGIPEKDLPFIFERFYRSDLSRTKNTGGSGIGLTITKAFVEAHGGRISVKSELNIGTTFTIVFPDILKS